MKMYLAKILNALIQFFFFTLLSNPFFFTSTSSTYFGVDLSGYSSTLRQADIRGNMELPFTPEVFECRLDQVAAGLVNLVTVDFLTSKLIAFATCNVNVLVAKIQKKPYKKDQFQVAQKMVNLLYFQGKVNTRGRRRKGGARTRASLSSV